MRLLVMLVAVVALAGCSAPDESESRTTTTATTSPPPSPPAVTRPLDAEAYRDRACDLLTKAQIAEHHVIAAENTELSDQRGALCLLERSEPHATIKITYLGTVDLLGAVHRQELPWLRSPIPFELATVSGQPALRAESILDCDLAIGLADTQGVVVSLQLLEDTRQEPCARAMAVGEDIVRNLAG